MLTPYPSSAPTQEGMAIILDALRGNPVDKSKAVLVVWNAAGYGLSLGFPDNSVGSVSDEEAANMIDGVLKGGVGFNWLVLLPVIIRLLEKLLEKK